LVYFRGLFKVCYYIISTFMKSPEHHSVNSLALAAAGVLALAAGTGCHQEKREEFNAIRQITDQIGLSCNTLSAGLRLKGSDGWEEDRGHSRCSCVALTDSDGNDDGISCWSTYQSGSGPFSGATTHFSGVAVSHKKGKLIYRDDRLGKRGGGNLRRQKEAESSSCGDGDNTLVQNNFFEGDGCGEECETVIEDIDRVVRELYDEGMKQARFNAGN